MTENVKRQYLETTRRYSQLSEKLEKMMMDPEVRTYLKRKKEISEELRNSNISYLTRESLKEQLDILSLNEKFKEAGLLFDEFLNQVENSPKDLKEFGEHREDCTHPLYFFNGMIDYEEINYGEYICVECNHHTYIEASKREDFERLYPTVSITTGECPITLFYKVKKDYYDALLNNSEKDTVNYVCNKVDTYNLTSKIKR